jgi:ABC-type nickel/cobalt efflux system permease component RcnA
VLDTTIALMSISGVLVASTMAWLIWLERRISRTRPDTNKTEPYNRHAGGLSHPTHRRKTEAAHRTAVRRPLIANVASISTNEVWQQHYAKLSVEWEEEAAKRNKSSQPAQP